MKLTIVVRLTSWTALGVVHSRLESLADQDAPDLDQPGLAGVLAFNAVMRSAKGSQTIQGWALRSSANTFS